jgi:hypothetical protein
MKMEKTDLNNQTVTCYNDGGKVHTLNSPEVQRKIEDAFYSNNPKIIGALDTFFDDENNRTDYTSLYNTYISLINEDSTAKTAFKIFKKIEINKIWQEYDQQCLEQETKDQAWKKFEEDKCYEEFESQKCLEEEINDYETIREIEEAKDLINKLNQVEYKNNKRKTKTYNLGVVVNFHP